MRNRRPTFLLLAFLLVAAVGCSRGNGNQLPPPPEPVLVQPAPKPSPVEPEPEIEPIPGEAVKLTLPKDGGKWPWSVGKFEEPPASQPVSFRNVAPFAVTGIAVRPELNRAVVSIRVDPTKKGQTGITTRVVLCDTSAGKPMTEWHVPGHYTVLDLSPDGRSILATHPQSGRERGILRLWAIGADGQLKRWSWTPHTPVRDGLRTDSLKASDAGGVDVRWAAFSGLDRVVSASRAGQVRVYEVEGLKPMATMDATPGRPALSPDGTKLAFLIGTSVALLDTRTLKLVGTRWVGPAPPHPVLAFSPDGARLAIGGNGRMILLTLTSGDLQSITIPKLDVNDNGIFDKPFGWAGATQLLADGLLFDPQLPQPAWEYSGAEIMQFRGWQVWACTRERGSSIVTLRGHTLPTYAAASAIAAVKASTGSLAIQPGAAIKIDVSELPEERRAEAQSMLEARLREIGFTLDPAAPVSLVATVDSPGTRSTVIYTGHGSHQYTRKPARLRLMLNGKELWNEGWAVEPPFAVEVSTGGYLANYLSKLGTGLPDYKAFATAPIPSHIPGSNSPTAPLGNTDLATDRPRTWLMW